MPVLKPRDWSSNAPLYYPPYRSTVLRAPKQTLIELDHPEDISGPVYDGARLDLLDHDLTQNARSSGAPIGERIEVNGQVLDDTGKPQAGILIEVWQANAAGRYIHRADTHDAPLDPNFTGAGRCMTDDDGRYKLITIKPGAYPWGNHENAWRPQHIHFSLIGSSLLTRLVTQMYFPGDPLLDIDPIFQGVPDFARERLVSTLEPGSETHDCALGYRFDIILRGRNETPPELDS